MQKIASQKVGNHNSECFMSDDGKTIYVYVNGKEEKQIELESAWNIPSIKQSVIDGKLKLIIGDKVGYEADL